MKNIKIKYTPDEFRKYVKKVLLSLTTGLFGIVWTIILLLSNGAIWCAQRMSEGIRKKPLLSVVITFTVMVVVAIGIHMDMKYKLTTAEWERDSLEQKLDSIRVFEKGSTTYYRYQPVH